MGIPELWLAIAIVTIIGSGFVIKAIYEELKGLKEERPFGENEKWRSLAYVGYGFLVVAVTLSIVNCTVFRKWDSDLGRVNYGNVNENVRLSSAIVVGNEDSIGKKFTDFQVEDQIITVKGTWEEGKEYVVKIGDNGTKRIEDDQIREVWDNGKIIEG